MAANSAGVVLSVSGRQHTLELVNRGHVVHSYRFHGRLASVVLGSRIRIIYSAARIKHTVAKHGLARTVSFLAQVVRIGPHGLVVRLGDRKILRLPAKLIRSASAKSRAVATGTVVLITENVGRHTIKPVSLKPVSTSSTGGKPTVTGAVVELDPNALVLQSADGSTHHFAVATNVITSASLQLSLCDMVSVSYHGAGSTLVADSVQSSDGSPGGPCANVGNGSGGLGAPGQDAVGTITQLTLSSTTITTASGAPQSFAATVDTSGGFMIGDQVDVTYNPGSNGTLVASDIQYQPLDAIGAVTAVDGGSVTLTDSTTNQSERFTDDPSNQTFDGISVGDQVDVSYHNSAAGTTVDSVSDMTNCGC